MKLRAGTTMVTWYREEMRHAMWHGRAVTVLVPARPVEEDGETAPMNVLVGMKQAMMVVPLDCLVTPEEARKRMRPKRCEQMQMELFE